MKMITNIYIWAIANAVFLPPSRCCSTILSVERTSVSRARKQIKYSQEMEMLSYDSTAET